MNLYGEVRDRLPRIILPLPERGGGAIDVNFIVDTAFDGELALPASVIAQVEYYSPSTRRVLLSKRRGARQRLRPPSHGLERRKTHHRGIGIGDRERFNGNRTPL